MSTIVQGSKIEGLPEKIAAHHPAFVGHFPDDPLLPGVVVLDKLIQRVQKHYTSATGLAQSHFSKFCLESVKFLHSVRPNDEIAFQWEEQGSRLRFQIHCQTTLVAQGSLVIQQLELAEQAEQSAA